jgi:hypothetical protein
MKKKLSQPPQPLKGKTNPNPNPNPNPKTKTKTNVPVKEELPRDEEQTLLVAARILDSVLRKALAQGLSRGVERNLRPYSVQSILQVPLALTQLAFTTHEPWERDPIQLRSHEPVDSLCHRDSPVQVSTS